jgi:hypothetical protein
MRNRTWELETIRFDPEPKRTLVVVHSRDEAITALEVPKDSHCFVRVSLSEGNVSWGEFELWCSDNRAVARILEHREHNARERYATVIERDEVVFRNEDSSLFRVRFSETVPRESAVIALEEWMRDLKHPEALLWS